jgi:protein SDA1
MMDYFKFFAHVSHCYNQQIAGFLCTEIINLLQQYYSILNPEMRTTLVTSLKVMRNKETAQASQVLPVLLKLFKCKDKSLRKYLHSIVIADMKLINKSAKNHGVNKKLQNFILGLLQEPNEDAARRSLNVMIELYKRHIWNDDKTVNSIWAGCEHQNPKIVAASCKFFLILDYDHQSESESDSSDEDPNQLLAKHKGGIMTNAKKEKFKRAAKAYKRKEERRNRIHTGTDFLPIDILYDPQASAERLFSKLKKSNDKYDVKLLMLRLVSRLIGRHNLLILSFYPYVLRYLNSHDKDKVGEIFAMIIESCHDLVPPEEMRPVLERIINNYVTDYCSPMHITIGLNAIREILLRMPLALDSAQVEYLTDFRGNRNKSVRAAAKSLINYFRDVCPQMLPKKLVGRFTEVKASDVKMYGERQIATDIDGAELLREGADIATQRFLTDEDMKKIRLLKLKNATKHVDRKRFRDSDSEESKFEKESEEDYDSESQDAEEMGEDEMSASVSSAEAKRLIALSGEKALKRPLGAESSEEEDYGMEAGESDMMDEMGESE